MRWDALRTARMLGMVLAALVLAAVVAGLGPEDSVICGRGHALNRLAQAIMQPLGAGHIDGPAANHCIVPSTDAWVLSAGVFFLLLGFGLFAAQRRRGSSLRTSA